MDLDDLRTRRYLDPCGELALLGIRAEQRVVDAIDHPIVRYQNHLAVSLPGVDREHLSRESVEHKKNTPVSRIMRRRVSDGPG